MIADEIERINFFTMQRRNNISEQMKLQTSIKYSGYEHWFDLDPPNTNRLK
jgi:hypothetical protein